MALEPKHERWLVLLIALHSAIIGGMLMFAPAWAVRFGGWEGADPLFFIRQAGAFHFVVVAGYLIELYRYRGVSFLITTKTIAFVFLSIASALGTTPWAVSISGVVDGIMALAVLLAHRAVRQR